MATLEQKIKFRPVVNTDGTLSPSPEELKYAQDNAADGALLEMNQKYENLNKQIKTERKESAELARMTPTAPTKESTERFVSRLEMPPAGPVVAPALVATENTKPIAEKEKELARPTPSPLVGGDVPRGSSTTDGKPKEASSQDEIEKNLKELGALQARLGANKLPDRGQLESLIKELDSLQPSTPPSSPETQKFVQARADAYRAYKEKADRNDWLEIAQNLVNSITQFASAQAAMGTRFAGGNVPLTGIDYGARTARAGREYEMELGEVSAQEKAALTEQERADRLRREEMAGKRGTLMERIRAKEGEIRAGEERAERARGEAVSLFKVINDNKQQDKALANTLKVKTEQLKQEGREAAGKELDAHLRILESQQKTLADKIQAANALSTADKKTYDKALVDFATSLGVSSQDLTKKADVESGWTTTDKTYMKENVAAKQAADWSQQYQEMQRQIEALRAVKMGEQATPAAPMAPMAPSATTPPSAPAQKYQPGDIVEQGGKKYRFKGGNDKDPNNYEEVR